MSSIIPDEPHKNLKTISYNAASLWENPGA
jgi:hypothetical protein